MLYVCLYVYEDSNFGGFRISHVYPYAHKWREHQALATGSATFEFHRTYAKRAMEEHIFIIFCGVSYIISPLSINIAIYTDYGIKHHGKMVLFSFSTLTK